MRPRGRVGGPAGRVMDKLSTLRVPDHDRGVTGRQFRTDGTFSGDNELGIRISVDVSRNQGSSQILSALVQNYKRREGGQGDAIAKGSQNS